MHGTEKENKRQCFKWVLLKQCFGRVIGFY